MGRKPSQGEHNSVLAVCGTRVWSVNILAGALERILSMGDG